MTISGRGVGGEQTRLAPQQVEILRRGRAVGDAQIILGGELQEALQPRAGMLRPLALVAVRQQQHQRRHCRHLARAAAMNWSIITCPALAKSPNCASQSTSASGAWTL